jgi:hypothetical protein
MPISFEGAFYGFVSSRACGSSQLQVRLPPDAVCPVRVGARRRTRTARGKLLPEK